LPIIVVGSLKSEKNIYRIINFIPYSKKIVKKREEWEKNGLCTSTMWINRCLLSKNKRNKYVFE
ncbi:hypothetical protein ACPTF2_14405, partial [Enterococcus faecalis]|uniref:hypothetical protein n=1 Tax=Enterococcus faecalis TaxID=1351 RepID=UPI003CC671F1